MTLPRLILASNCKYNIGESGLYAGGELDIDITSDGRRNTLLKTSLLSFDPHMGINVGFKDFLCLEEVFPIFNIPPT